MKRWLVVFAVFLVLFANPISLHAQTDPAPAVLDQSANSNDLWTTGELDILLGPVALYPDPLLAVLLPAATQPTDIVLAVRFLNSDGDPNLIDEQPWDENVRALAHYPEVIRWMDENLAWTRQVGEAFLLQPEDVMTAIQRLREYARQFGNLYTTPEQIVEVEDGTIDILPADSDTFYLPVYDPPTVYTRPAIVGGRAYVTYAKRLSVGPWLKRDWDWRNRRVITWTKTNYRPTGWWSQPRAQRTQSTGICKEWTPHARSGQPASKFWASRQQVSGKASPAAASKPHVATPSAQGGAARSTGAQNSPRQH